jgi:hypothetical protein
MNKILSMSLFCLICLYSNSQIIDNKIDLCIGYGIGKFGGDVMVMDNGFIAPSLYSNYDNLYWISFKGIFLKKQHFSFGAVMNYSSASEWNTDLYTDYINSGIFQYSLSPLVQIHSKPVETGLFNRVSLFLEIAPTLGLSKLSLANPLFDIKDENSLVVQPMERSDFFYGMKGATGIKVSLNQDIGAFIEFSYGYYLVSSKLYSDNHYSDYGAEAGIIFRLKKNKRYFY